MNDQYKLMWEEFGRNKAYLYSGYKFMPTHRVGLTNYVRECVVDELLRSVPHEQVADIGCATGRQLLRARDTIKLGFGLDIAESFIEEANKQNEKLGVTHISFQAAQGEIIPANDNSFDVVINSEVIEHVHDKDVMLNELRRIVKPGGFLLLTTPNMNADGTWWGRLMRALKLRKFESLEHFSIDELAKHGDAHVREFTARSLVKLLRAHHFEIEKVRFCSYIDGPYVDAWIKYPLHVAPLRWFTVLFERLLTRSSIPLGRHLIVLARRIA